MLSERIIGYAVAEFEKALRQMSATRSPFHTFCLSDKPPLDMMIIIGPRQGIQTVMDQMDKTIEQAQAIHTAAAANREMLKKLD